MSDFGEVLGRRAEDLAAMTGTGWIFTDVPADPIVLVGGELPLRPRCWICGAIRVDYTGEDIDTGEVRRYSDVITSHDMAVDHGPHEWTDSDEPYEGISPLP